MIEHHHYRVLISPKVSWKIKSLIAVKVFSRKCGIRHPNLMRYISKTNLHEWVTK